MKRGRNLRLLSIFILLLALVVLAALNVGVFTSKPPLEGESTSASDGSGATERRRQHITNRSSEIIHSKSVSIIARDDVSTASSQQGIREGTSKFPAEEEETGQSKGRDAANSATEKKPKGPILFDHSNGWNGSTYEEGFIFCRNIAGSSRNLCPWAAYCPKSQLLGGLEIDVNISKKELWAPQESQGQPVWVSVGAINPCMQRGSLDKREKTNIPFIMCCNEGEENVIDVNTRAEIENQTDLFLNDWTCRNECHLPNSTGGSIADISTPQRYCIARCRSVRHKHALSRVKDFFKALPKQSEDLLNGRARCIERCHKLGNNTEESLIPPLPQQYCLARCRWMYRQEALSRLGKFSEVNKHSNNSLASSLLKGHCNDISDKLHYNGICTAVAHRQKPKVNLILSTKSWSGSELDVGVRDCAGSRCIVSTGPGHSDSSHVFVSTNQQVEHSGHMNKLNADQINVNIYSDQLAENNASTFPSHLNSSIDWIVSKSQARQLCDICDKYANEVAPASKWTWNMSLGLETVDQCLIDILSRHTLPDNLPPLINPSFGFDAVFVTNYTPLKDRRDVMLERVREHLNTDPIFITDFDREEISDEDMECIGNREAQMAYVGRYEKRGSYSLIMKHAAAWFYVIQHSLDNVLVLEDDASFPHPDWVGKDSLWQEMLQNLPPNYDVLILCGEQGRFNRGEKVSEHLFRGQHSRATDAYLVSQKGARNLLRSLPMVSSISAQMNYAAAEHDGQKEWMKKLPGFHGPRTINLLMYHAEPPLSAQKDLNKTRNGTWNDE